MNQTCIPKFWIVRGDTVECIVSVAKFKSDGTSETSFFNGSGDLVSLFSMSNHLFYGFNNIECGIWVLPCESINPPSGAP